MKQMIKFVIKNWIYIAFFLICFNLYMTNKQIDVLKDMIMAEHNHRCNVNKLVEKINDTYDYLNEILTRLERK